MNVSLKSPKSGDYRSAYVLYDIDHDSVDEAIAFYTSGADVSFIFLKKMNEEWKPLADFKGYGSDIYNLEFSDLTHNGTAEIVISWDSFETNIKTLTVFEFTGSTLQEIFRTTYSAMKVLDVNGQSGDEILTINQDEKRKESLAKLYGYINGSIQQMGEAKLDSSATNYTSIRYDLPTKYNPTILYIDSFVGQSKRLTEILYWKSNTNNSSGRLVAPLNDPLTGVNENTLRDINITTRDVNGDGLMEVPKSYRLCGAEKNDSDTSLSLVQWNRFDQDGLIPLTYGIVNMNDQYLFMFPDNWVDRVTVRTSTENRRWSFYFWNQKDEQLEISLLVIEVNLRSKWEENPTDGFVKIGEKGNLVYLAQIFDNNSEFDITLDTVKANLVYLN